MQKSLLLHSENVLGLNYLIKVKGLAGKIDLVYIDPPFATGGVFSVSNGRAATISNSRNGKIAYHDTIIGNEFLDFLECRLELLKVLLSEKGSIYVHIDYKVGHYVKILMDKVFGAQNFRNDITRIKCNPKNFKRIGFGNVKDMILFYTKSSNPIWNEPYQDYKDEDVIKLFPKLTASGRRYTTVPLHAPGETINGNSSKPFKGINPPEGRHWRTDVETMERWDAEGLIEWSGSGNPRKMIFADEKVGKRMQDIWEFKDPQYPRYPTEKNIEMLDLIVKTSSQPGSVVLDCFCGSGTTLVAAERQKRLWIGIDQSDLAITTVRERLENKDYDLFTGPLIYDFLDLSQEGDLQVFQGPILSAR